MECSNEEAIESHYTERTSETDRRTAVLWHAVGHVNLPSRRELFFQYFYRFRPVLSDLPVPFIPVQPFLERILMVGD